MIFCIFSIKIATAIDFQKLSALAGQRYGESTKKTVLQLQALLSELKSAQDKEKLKRINDFFNAKITFDDDMAIWGVSDYWATPLESLGKGRGDCEDYAIAKYAILRALDIPDEKLKLTYVRAQIGGPHSKVFQAHMVLSYYATPSSEPLILDNLIADVLASSRRIDLTPIFSFNSEGLWAGTNTATGDSSLNNLSRWRNVITRMQQDGIE
jgi:predicted transglutaminase-like cysteine proteinase